MMFRNTKRSKLGFSLIELLIAIAIVAILAAVAVPSYQSQVRESRRMDAAGVLMQARQAMERYYSNNFTYVGAAAGATFSAQSPIDGGNIYYVIDFAAGPAAATYTISATPQGGQAGDACGILTIDQAGTKNQADGQVVQDCWQ